MTRATHTDPQQGSARMPCPPESSVAPPGPSLVDTAIWCAQRGWPVHPLVPGRKIPAANCSHCREKQDHEPVHCPCLQAGRWCHGFHAATTDLDRIRAWWDAQPRFGVAVSCGPANVVVLDVDAHASKHPQRDRLLPGIPIHPSIDLTGLENGFHTLALLAAYRRQPNPCHDDTTLRVETASGGMHIWYSLPADLRLRSSRGADATTALAWQVDVRANKGYVVAPFTCTSKGTYRPLGTVRDPAPLPQWLAEELIRTGHGIASSPAPSSQTIRPLIRRTGGPVDGLRRLLEDIEACAVADEGTGFTGKLNKAAFTAGGLVAAGRLSRTEAVDRLTYAAEAARPNQRVKIARIISDGLTAGALRPLHLEGRS
ncbi:bifunctional DNA primase/polymerase [Streptomyces parvulus]|uniref:bifunctional DNA primase/polymerase n=1 Tax=Streptomyces parvulus TaxID=146923 RepID=UPI0037A439FC